MIPVVRTVLPGSIRANQKRRIDKPGASMLRTPEKQLAGLVTMPLPMTLQKGPQIG